MYLLLIASQLCYLIKYLFVFMTGVHTYFYIVVDTQLGCHTLKLWYCCCNNVKLYMAFHNVLRDYKHL